MPASQIYLAQTVLTDAQTKALPTTPIVLIEGIPDAIIFPLFAHLRMNWVADYADIDGTADLRIIVGAGTETLVPLRQSLASSVSGLLAGGGPDGTNAYMTPFFIFAAGVFTSISSLYDSDIVNQDITLRISGNTSGDLTGGNAGNSLAVQVAYMILPALPTP